MAKIHYKKITLPLTSEVSPITIARIENDGSQELTITASPKDFSFVIVDEKRYKLRDGTAKINADEIEDGIREVAFISSTRRTAASPVLKVGNSFGRAPLDSGIAEAIEITLVALTEKLRKTEERILALEESVKPKNIFNFT